MFHEITKGIKKGNILRQKFKPQVLRHAVPQKSQHSMHMAFGNIFAIITEVPILFLTQYTWSTFRTIRTLAFHTAATFQVVKMYFCILEENLGLDIQLKSRRLFNKFLCFNILDKDCIYSTTQKQIQCKQVAQLLPKTLSKMNMKLCKAAS